MMTESPVSPKDAPRRPESAVGRPAPSSVLARRIIVLAVVLTAASALLIKVTGSRAELAETNYQANLIRLQDLMFGPAPKSVLVGSSISGRLLPSYFKGSQLEPVANLGLDGSGPPLGLQFCLERPAKMVFVEINTILKEWDKNDATLEDAARSTTFQLARHVPLLRAGFRPSSVIYSWLKARHSPAQQPLVEKERSVPMDAIKEEKPVADIAVDLPPGARISATKVEDAVKRLRTAGCKVILVNVPAGAHTSTSSSLSYTFAHDLSQRLGIPFVDLAVECEKRKKTLSYTDGLHLTPVSARLVAEVLGRAVEGRTPGN